MPLEAIRTATEEDARAIARVLRAGFGTQARELGFTRESNPRHPAFWSAERVRRAMRDGFSFLVLEADGRPAGCVAIRTAAPIGGDGFLGRLAVLPECRGRGFGELLVRFAEAVLRDRGARTVRLGVLAPLTGLQDWYRRQGYVLVECLEEEPVSVVWMDKPLVG